MLKRLNDLRNVNDKLYSKIAERQRRGRMSYFVDNEGYVCYDDEELKNWKPRKAGRKPKYFKCEICGEETLEEYEGSVPNCCEDCMPLSDDDIRARKRHLELQKPKIVCNCTKKNKTADINENRGK